MENSSEIAFIILSLNTISWIAGYFTGKFMMQIKFERMVKEIITYKQQKNKIDDLYGRD